MSPINYECHLLKKLSDTSYKLNGYFSSGGHSSMKSSIFQSIGCIILSISTSRDMLDGASGEAGAREGDED